MRAVSAKSGQGAVVKQCDVIFRRKQRPQARDCTAWSLTYRQKLPIFSIRRLAFAGGCPSWSALDVNGVLQ
jgi:hypothetical protein